jgi:hypothetical protein
MVKPLVVVKYQRGPQGPSQRTLRRAVRSCRRKVSFRATIFLLLFSLVAAAIGMSVNRNLERREHEHILSVGHQEK